MKTPDRAYKNWPNYDDDVANKIYVDLKVAEGGSSGDIEELKQQNKLLQAQIQNNQDTIKMLEDDKDINELLATAVKRAGYDIVQAWSGTEAAMLFSMKDREISLVLLDLMLPGMPGEELLTLIRKKCDIPVIVITAKDELDDKIDIFAKGADDYITKPFEIEEVIARIQVQLRHKNKDMVSDLITYGKLRLDRKAHRIYISDEAVDCITKQEFSILELLMEHPKQVFSKEDIFEYAWDEPYMGETKTLDVHISNIRKKLKKITETEYIETVWGIGYKLKE